MFQMEKRSKVGDVNNLNEIRTLVEKNELQPVLDRSFPLRQAENAVQHVIDRGESLVGKVSIAFADI